MRSLLSRAYAATAAAVSGACRARNNCRRTSNHTLAARFSQGLPMLIGRSAATRVHTRQLLSNMPTPGRAVGIGAMIAGMGCAAAGGIAIGMALPTERVLDMSRDAGQGSGSSQERAKTSGSGPARSPTIYEDEHDVARELPRPAMVQDVRIDDIEALYEFKSCLASGGSGAVWRAREKASGREVAIKVIDKKLLSPALFNMEVYSMQRCAGHPNILQLLAAYDVAPYTHNNDGEWHLVMELAQGGELFNKLVQHGAYSEQMAAKIVNQIARGVYHLHSCGVCHRDIKPENVVLMTDEEEDVQVKLIDFGAAVVLEEDEQVISGGRVGTWTYWAPEQADETAPYDCAVDMWSIGVLLYVMLSGRHPFEKPGADGRATLERILAAEYAMDGHEWKSISGRAKQLVAQLLEPDPDKRLTAAELLSHSWVRGERVSSRPLPDTVERLRAFKKAGDAIHGSLLLAALLHQESVRKASDQLPMELRFAQGASEPGEGLPASPSKARLRRTYSLSEGVGMMQPHADFDVVRAAYQLFDTEGKGYIIASDITRVCAQLGLELTERDTENMLSVLAPSVQGTATTDDESDVPVSLLDKHISYSKFATMMQSSYRRRFKPGEAVFQQGDAVTGFYIIIAGELSVQARASKGAEPREVTRLGPGDFFGETGLLEGRESRNTTVRCITPAEVLMIDKSMFLKLAAAPEGTAANKLAGKIRQRTEARQRARLRRAIEMVETAPMQKLSLKAGELVYSQGEPASCFYIVSKGELNASFIASTGEEATYRTYTTGDQFGYDTLLGATYDTTVVCTSDARAAFCRVAKRRSASAFVELIAVPREQLQRAFTEDSYLQSVWRAPAENANQLRRQVSLARRTRGGGGEFNFSVHSSAHGAGGGGDGAEALGAEELAPLLRGARTCTLAEGEPAFLQGSMPSAFYVLQQGECEVEYTSKRGEKNTVARLKPGEHFGENAILEGRQMRNSSVRCVSPGGCSVSVVSKANFIESLKGNSRLAQRFEAVASQRTRDRLRTIITVETQRDDCAVETLAAGQQLDRSRDGAKCFYMVESGAVQLSYPTVDGRLLPVRLLHKGDVFGGTDLWAEGVASARQETAVALEPTTLKVVPHARFASVLRNDSLVATAVKNLVAKAEAAQRSI